MITSDKRRERCYVHRGDGNYRIKGKLGRVKGKSKTVYGAVYYKIEFFQNIVGHALYIAETL